MNVLCLHLIAKVLCSYLRSCFYDKHQGISLISFHLMVKWWCLIS